MVAAPVPRQFTFVVGLFLVGEGIWELFSPVVFGVFTSNQLHGAIHIVLGLCGLAAAAKGHASAFLTFLGALLILVGVLWFIPATRRIPEDMLNVNRAVAVFNVILGGVSLLVARDARRHARL